jgi:spore maturation protein CgeB
VFRRIIKDLLPTERGLGLYGTYWDQFVDEKYICGKHIPNNELRKAYSSCEILLNDHWEDMSKEGFISNRIFDGFAAGAFIISDEINGAKDIFGDQLVTYKDSEDLHSLIEYYLDHPQERVKKVEKGREVVLEHHTFEKRAARILEIIEKSEKTCPICNRKSSTFFPSEIQIPIVPVSK